MQEKLQEDTFYTLTSDQKANFTGFGIAMSLAQQKFNCCGVNSNQDYIGSKFGNDVSLKIVFV